MLLDFAGFLDNRPAGIHMDGVDEREREEAVLHLNDSKNSCSTIIPLRRDNPGTLAARV